MKTVFITGATGFLGSNLLKVILEDERTRAHILVRAKDTRLALRRGEALLNAIFPKPSAGRKTLRVQAVRGDILRDDLGLSAKDFHKLQDTVDAIYHCAAVREFGYGLEAIRKVNVGGTENLLKTALKWKRRGRLENVNHISTAYVAGDYKGRFYETQLDMSQGFNNTYEQSKFEAEKAVLRYRRKSLAVDIYRPSIITDAIPPNKDNLSMAFRFLTIFTLQLFRGIPAGESAEFNLIPIDTVSRAIYLISTTKERPLNQNYHIVNPRPVKVDTLLSLLSSAVGFKRPRFIPMERFRMEDLTPVQRKLIEGFIPYLNQGLSFDMKNASSLLSRYHFKFPRITKALLAEAFRHYQAAGLISRKGQSCC